MLGPGYHFDVCDSIELCIVELTRVACIWKNKNLFGDRLGCHLGFLSSPSVMPIYAGSFRNYRPYRTFWYMTRLVLRGGPGYP